MKVLLVSHYFETHGGGIEFVVSHLARELAKRNVEVNWAATGEPGGVPERIPGARRIPMCGFNLVEKLTGFPYPVWLPASYPALRRAIRDSDVVHVHDGVYFGSQLAGRIARGEGKPVVVTQHIGKIPFSNPLYRFAQGIANSVLTWSLLEKSDQVVFVSDFVRREFSSLRFKAEPLTIYNGVDLELFSPGIEPLDSIRKRLGIEIGRPTFLFVGRFSPKKGLLRIREAAAHLSDIQWILIGGGKEDPTTWGLSNVRIPGRQTQESLPDWYRSADLLVLPSVGEGFPLVVQEAMACGTPCLVSEEVRNASAQAGPLLLSAGPEAESLVPVAEDLRNSSARLAGLRKAVARFASQQWSWSLCVSQYLSLYETVPRSPGRQGHSFE